MMRTSDWAHILLEVALGAPADWWVDGCLVLPRCSALCWCTTHAPRRCRLDVRIFGDSSRRHSFFSFFFYVTINNSESSTRTHWLCSYRACEREIGVIGSICDTERERGRQRELHLWTPALPPGYCPFFFRLPTRSVVAQVHVRLCGGGWLFFFCLFFLRGMGGGFTNQGKICAFHARCVRILLWRISHRVSLISSIIAKN